MQDFLHQQYLIERAEHFAPSFGCASFDLRAVSREYVNVVLGFTFQALGLREYGNIVVSVKYMQLCNIFGVGGGEGVI